MRLRAMIAVQSAKTDEDKKYMQAHPDAFKKVWVSVVDADTDAKKLEIALSDNDRVGYYEEDKLAELLLSVGDDAQLDLYKVDIGEPISLADVLVKFAPGDEESPRLDQREDKMCQCPKCGHIGLAKIFEYTQPVEEEINESEA